MSYTDADPDPSIYVVRADGRGLHEVGKGSHPDWSPGGHRIAYNGSTLDSDVGAVYALDPDGSTDVLLARSVGNTAYEMPTWSPDGERLAFTVVAAPDSPGSSSTPYLAVVNQPGGRIRGLAGAPAFEPDWSPDGRRIIYTLYRRTAEGSTSEIRLLYLIKHTTSRLHGGWHPRWSPDGRRIVFSAGIAGIGPSQVYVMDADGSNVRQLTR